MNKLAGMAGMRNWANSDRGFMQMHRPAGNAMPSAHMMPHPKSQAPHGMAPIQPSSQTDQIIHYSFNVPFASDLAGPNTEDIVYGTRDAVLRWTHPGEAPDNVPVHDLPVHAANVAILRQLCKDLTTGPLPIEAYVKSSEPKRVKGQVTNVCLTGSPELVHKSRETILNDTPLALVCCCDIITYVCDIRLKTD